MSNQLDKTRLDEVAKKAVRDSLRSSGALAKPQTPTIVQKVTEAVEKGKKLLSEALVVLPKTFALKTQWLSAKTKTAHEKLYQGYVARFNTASSHLDTVKRENVTDLRNLKLEETYNLNGVKLHELYFGNIADPNSQVHRDSIPYMRLTRDWGTFENWQYDFLAVGEAAREGWVALYYDPFKNRYLNAMIDGHASNMPLCAIPVLVMDMWAHAYYADFLNDKTSYLRAMMREINWSIVEARMVVAERANLHDLYAVRPLVDSTPTRMVDQASNVPPIGKDQINPGGVESIPAPGSTMQVNPRPPVGSQQNKVQ